MENRVLRTHRINLTPLDSVAIKTDHRTAANSPSSNACTFNSFRPIFIVAINGFGCQLGQLLVRGVAHFTAARSSGASVFTSERMRVKCFK